MCGIAGILGRPEASAENLAERALAMMSSLRHRGPDANGIYRSTHAPLALVHTRLAIIDVSPAGAQPMHSPAGDAVIVFNGEIYNFGELKAELDSMKSTPWRGHSDTEVMLEGIGQWGVERAVRRFNGMFAFAVWQNQQRALTLARDRLGVKPLFLARSGDGAIIFGSEMRSLTADRQFPARLNRASLPPYFGNGYIPRRAPVYEDVVNLAPGSMVSFHSDAGEVDWAAFRHAAESLPDGQFDCQGKGWHYRSYWNAVDPWDRTKAEAFEGGFGHAVDEAEKLLRNAVGLRMVADVPLGAFLSGGIDSSLVVALMQAQATRPVRTFCAGFDDKKFDESAHAAAVALHLRTDHTTLHVGRGEAIQVAEALGSSIDEPLADSSFIPTFLVAELTRRHVTVAMTGDGGDELLAGYWRYRVFRRLRLPYAVPAVVRACIDAAARGLEIPLPARRDARWMYYRLLRLIRVASQPDFPSAYAYASTNGWPARVLNLGRVAPKKPRTAPFALDLAEQMMLFDTHNYLPDDLLVKVDRASMAVSLECREPLLDYRFYELAARLPLNFKLENGVGKRLLREILYKHVPRELVDRPKQGFAVPLRRWLREDLKKCVEQTLFDRSPSDELFAMPVLRKLWTEHQADRWDHGHVLWSAFVLRQWLAANRWM